MKNQALFSLKDKSKKLKCRPLQFLCGALRLNNFGSLLFVVINQILKKYQLHMETY